MSEGFSVTIEIPDLVNDYKLIFESQMYECMKAAARKFLLILATRFPVRTGFLRGSLTPLENILGAVQRQDASAGARNPYQVRRNRRPTTKPQILKEEYYYPPDHGSKILKTTRSGIPFATPESEIFESATMIKGSIGKIIFKYKIDISYLSRNDNYPGSRGRPWNAYKDAIQAFTDEFNEKFPKYVPDLNKFVMKKRITLTGNTIQTQNTVWK